MRLIKNYLLNKKVRAYTEYEKVNKEHWLYRSKIDWNEYTFEGLEVPQEVWELIHDKERELNDKCKHLLKKYRKWVKWCKRFNLEVLEYTYEISYKTKEIKVRASDTWHAEKFVRKHWRSKGFTTKIKNVEKMED